MSKEKFVVVVALIVILALVFFTPLPRTPFNGAWLLCVIIAAGVGAWLSKKVDVR